MIPTSISLSDLCRPIVKLDVRGAVRIERCMRWNILFIGCTAAWSAYVAVLDLLTGTTVTKTITFLSFAARA
jgi:hypothetical protein